MMSLRTRVLALILLAGASTVSAQALDPATQLQVDDLRARQQAAERQAVEASNQAMAAEARIRAEQAINELERQRAISLDVPPGAAPDDGVGTALKDYPVMPDAVLADSNKRVRAAAKRH